MGCLIVVEEVTLLLLLLTRSGVDDVGTNASIFERTSSPIEAAALRQIFMMILVSVNSSLVSNNSSDIGV